MGSKSELRLDLGAILRKTILEGGGTDEGIKETVERRHDVIKDCARRFVHAEHETKSRIELSLVVHDNESFEALVAAGHYNFIDPGITPERFPIHRRKSGKRKLVLLHFNCDISSENAIKEAKSQGLTRPTYEDCLRFGAQYPEIQRGFPIPFLHKPVLYGNGDPSVLYLYSEIDVERDLICHSFGHYWSINCRFAFIYKPSKNLDG